MTTTSPGAGHEADAGRLAAEARAILAGLAARTAPLSNRDRLAVPPQEMACQPAAERIRNMNEVALGYSAEQARVEASRCLMCPTAPCVKGCPAGIDIPGFVAAAAAGDFARAIAVIKASSVLPAVCGRVCPQEVQCQLHCTVGKALRHVDKAVAIGRIERFVADWEREQGLLQPPAVKPESGRRVAVIGSGPAGLTVAADVRREGHAVTVFEAFHRPGGVLLYGIPEFRLPKRIVDIEVDLLRRMGVRIVTNFVVGRTRTLRDLLDRDGFDAAFIGTGAGLPTFLGVPGEDLVGVFSANEYLTRANLMQAYRRDRADTPIVSARNVAVLGGGNTAMDVARTLVRMGADEVHLIYRRTEAEMPARAEEVRHAREEGVVFHFLQNVKQIIGDEYGRVRSVECQRYELGSPDQSGRRRPVPIPDSEFLRRVDTVVVAIGNSSNPLLKQTTPALAVNKWGNLVVDDDGRTSVPHVYAGGDIVLGAATVILAMGQGRRAAAAIIAELAAAPPR